MQMSPCGERMVTPTRRRLKTAKASVRPTPNCAMTAADRFLLVALILRQVLVSQPLSEVADVPGTGGVVPGFRMCGTSQRLFIECVRDQLAQGKRHRPMLQDLVDVEIERVLSEGRLRRRRCCHARLLPRRRELDTGSPLTTRRRPSDTEAATRPARPVFQGILYRSLGPFARCRCQPAGKVLVIVACDAQARPSGVRKSQS